MPNWIEGTMKVRGKAFMVTENIVRCGECKRHSTCTRYRMQAKNDDWFCADGERKEQE